MTIRDGHKRGPQETPAGEGFEPFRDSRVLYMYSKNRQRRRTPTDTPAQPRNTWDMTPQRRADFQTGLRCDRPGQSTMSRPENAPDAPGRSLHEEASDRVGVSCRKNTSNFADSLLRADLACRQNPLVVEECRGSVLVRSHPAPGQRRRRPKGPVSKGRCLERPVSRKDGGGFSLRW